jgi:hypothetical protein
VSEHPDAPALLEEFTANHANHANPRFESEEGAHGAVSGHPDRRESPWAALNALPLGLPLAGMANFRQPAAPYCLVQVAYPGILV